MSIHLNRATILCLFVLLLITIGLTIWLLNRGANTQTAGISQTIYTSDLRVTMQIDAAALGPRVIDVLAHNSAGEPADLNSVRLRFSMREMDMGTLEADARPVRQGHFQARGSFFSMAGRWTVEAHLLRDGQEPLPVPFDLAIAAPGEASGPLNPLTPDDRTLTAGRLLYQANCLVCHGENGKGDGPAAAGLRPRPADFSQHLTPGKHTDGQVYLWINDGVPSTAMPAWEQRLSESQIWQVVTYLRTFGQNSQGAPTNGVIRLAQVPTVQEPLPALVFAREGNLWSSDGSGAPPRQLTSFGKENQARYPAASASGRQVAFISIVQAAPQPTSVLYVMDTDGANLRAVWKPEQGLLGAPAWTPDGRAIYVSISGPAAEGKPWVLQLVRVDVVTGGQQSVLPNALEPHISSDGTQMTYLQLNDDGSQLDLKVAALDGSGARSLLRNAPFQGFSGPRFSPDGKQILVSAASGPETDDQGFPRTAGRASPLDHLFGLLEPPTAEAHGPPLDVWIVNTDETGLRRLTALYMDDLLAAFSSDGKQIAMTSRGWIFVMNSDGTQLRRIGTLEDYGTLDWLPK